VTTEALPDSTLPDELRKLGYDVRENGESERMQFTMTADGEFEPLVEGSTKPVAQTRRHAGIATVDQFDLRMP
jgi:hypothetical protein